MPTGNTQQIIDYGAAPNDGTGDPLRTAFIKTDENFDNIWLAGPVGSNVRITNNTISAIDTNGNLILQPNGVGIVQANAHIIPSANNIRDLGSVSSAWRRAYINDLYLKTLSAAGDVIINGNLVVRGDTIEMGNITTDSLTIQLANTAINANQANGAGITVGANDDIATMLYDSVANRWNFNIGIKAPDVEIDTIVAPNLSVNNISSDDSSFVTIFDGLRVVGPIDATGTITGTYFVGNGSLLTGLVTVGGNNTQVQYNDDGNLAGDDGFTYNAANNTLLVSGMVNSGEHAATLGASGFTDLNSNVIVQITGNANSYTQINFQNIDSGSRATTDYIATAAFGTDSTFFVDMGIASNSYDSENPNNSLGNALQPQDSYLYSQGGNALGGSGGNLIVGSNEPGGVVRLIADGSSVSNIVATFSNQGIDIKGNAIPVADNQYTLGGIGNRWKDVWTTTLDVNDGSNTWTISGSNIDSPTGGQWRSETGSKDDYITSASNGYINLQSLFADGNIASEVHLEHGVVHIRVADGPFNDWYFRSSGTLETPGDIIPQANALYSLGSSTNYWANLWVANNTIYIGGVPLGITAGNVLTVNGEAILSNDSNTSITTSGNITANEFFGNLAASSIVGTVANAIYADTAGTAVSVPAGNVTGLATVATSGSYTDLSDTPVIPTATSNLINDSGFITASAIPSNVSAFNNDSGYITSATANVISVNGKTGLVTVDEYSNAAVADYLNSGAFTGDIITAGNIIGGNLYTTGTLTSGPQNVTGNINVAGNIIVSQGNLYYDQVYDLVVGDPLIYVGANNTGNVYDLGMVVSYNDGTYQHGGWVRDASDGTWKLFGNVVAEPTTTVDFTNAIYQPMQAGTITATGNITGSYILGNGSQLSGLSTVAVTGNYANLSGTPTNLNQFTNGPGYITAATANVISVNGQTGVVVLSIPTTTSNLTNDSGFITTSNLASLTSDLSTTGNITGDYILGNGSQLTGLPTQYGNSNVTVLLSAFGSNTISTTGNVTAGYFIGNGSQLTGVANLSFTTVSANGTSLVADSATDTVTFTPGNNMVITGTAGTDTVTFAVSDSPTFTGNVTAQNFSGNISVTGNVTGTSANVDIIAGSYTWSFNNTGNLVLPGNTFTVNYANGTAVSLGGAGTYGDSNVTTLLSSFGSNSISTTGNVTAGYVLGNASQVTGLATVAKTGSYSDLSGVPTNLNQFTNGPGYITSATANVISVNGKTGVVTVTEYSNSAVSTFLAAYGSNTISTTGNITAGNITGTFVSPGSNTQVLFNDAGTIGGHASLTYNKTTGTLTALGVTNTGISAADFGIVSTELPNTVASFTANVNSYTQVTFQNKSTGADATADFILTADNGSDTVNYGDFGIINSGYDPNTPTNSLGNIVYAGDTYIYSQGNTSNTGQSGGNLVIGATVASKNIKLFAGGANTNALIATISNAGITMNSGNITGNTNGFAIGYRDIPQVSWSANATIALTDAGKHYYTTSASNITLTIANSSTANFAVGSAINIVNQGTGTMSILQGSGVTLYLAGNATSGNRTISSYGVATIQKVATDTWFIVGVGLT